MSATVEAINKIMDRVPEARFHYVGERHNAEFRIVVNGDFYWVKYHRSFSVEPEERLAENLFDQIEDENEKSKTIENRLNGIAEDCHLIRATDKGHTK